MNDGNSFIDDIPSQIRWLGSRSSQEITEWLRQGLDDNTTYPLRVSGRDIDMAVAFTQILRTALDSHHSDDLQVADLRERIDEAAKIVLVEVAEGLAADRSAEEPGAPSAKFDSLLFMIGRLGLLGSKHQLAKMARWRTAAWSDEVHRELLLVLYTLVEASRTELRELQDIWERFVPDDRYKNLCFRALCEFDPAVGLVHLDSVGQSAYRDEHSIALPFTFELILRSGEPEEFLELVADRFEGLSFQARHAISRALAQLPGARFSLSRMGDEGRMNRAVFGLVCAIHPSLGFEELEPLAALCRGDVNSFVTAVRFSLLWWWPRPFFISELASTFRLLNKPTREMMFVALTSCNDEDELRFVPSGKADDEQTTYLVCDRNGEMVIELDVLDLHIRDEEWVTIRQGREVSPFWDNTPWTVEAAGISDSHRAVG